MYHARQGPVLTSDESWGAPGEGGQAAAGRATQGDLPTGRHPCRPLQPAPGTARGACDADEVEVPLDVEHEGRGPPCARATESLSTLTVTTSGRAAVVGKLERAVPTAASQATPQPSPVPVLPPLGWPPRGRREEWKGLQVLSHRQNHQGE